MPMAARVGDDHLCPMVDPGPKPHLGGPILPPCCPTVIVGGQPQARVSDQATCTGPPDVISQGSPTVLVGSLQAARMGDPTAHGGYMIAGCPTVLIGGGSPIPGMSMVEASIAIDQALKDQRAMLEAKKAELEKWDDAAKANFQKWFGTTDEAARQQILDRINKELALNKNMTFDNFAKSDPEHNDQYAHVHHHDPSHTIFLDKLFTNAPPTGEDSKAGTLAHEMSHFDDIGDTHDHAYGSGTSKKLAETNPKDALNNADSFEYYTEGAD